MKRQVIYSFHYEKDSRRVAQIRNIGVIEGNTSVSDNDWEEVKKGGDEAIRRWIDSNLQYRSCLIVLVGEHTSERLWVDYEISMGKRNGHIWYIYPSYKRSFALSIRFSRVF